MAEETNLEIARNRAEEKAGFYTHLLIYLSVNLLLFFINITQSSQTLWFLGPLVGWGIGLAFHFAGVFVFDGIYQDFIRKQTQKELVKLEK